MEPETSGLTGLRQIDIDQIHPNRGQPRQQFDQTALEELARSIKRDGLLQPVLVRPYRNDEFELIAGERRWRAAQMAGLMRVPAIVQELADDRLLEVALVENIQREQLNPVEEATAYQALIDDLGLTQEEVAQRVGKQRATIANALRLLNLPKEIQTRVRDGEISAGHGKVLASIPQKAVQLELAEQVVKDGLSVRRLESLVSKLTSSSGSGVVAVKAPPPRDPNVVAAEEALQSTLGTKVRIVSGRKGGKLELYYYSDDELERLYNLLNDASSGAA